MKGMANVSGMSDTGGMTGMRDMNKMDGIGSLTGSTCMGFKWLKPVYIDMINIVFGMNGMNGMRGIRVSSVLLVCSLIC